MVGETLMYKIDGILTQGLKLLFIEFNSNPKGIRHFVRSTISLGAGRWLLVWLSLTLP